MKNATLASGIVTLCLTILLASPAGAQHAHSDMAVGTTADGGGELLIEYAFDSIVRTDFATLVGPVALYSATNPGFGAAEDEPLESVFALDDGTTVGMSVVAIDPNLQLQIGASVLAAPGDTAQIGTHTSASPLHRHPTFRLMLDAPEGEFGEGTVAFKLQADPSSPTAYGDSETYTLKVSNGYLPPVDELDPTAAARCQRAVAKEARTFAGKQAKNLATCLDAVQDAKAKGVDLGNPSGSLRGRCNPDPVRGLLARIASDRAKARDRASAVCGGIFQPVAIGSHLGMVQCRNEELIGATYSSALEDLATVVFGGDEEAAEAALPCVRETQGEA